MPSFLNCLDCLIDIMEHQFKCVFFYLNTTVKAAFKKIDGSSKFQIIKVNKQQETCRCSQHYWIHYFVKIYVFIHIFECYVLFVVENIM